MSAFNPPRPKVPLWDDVIMTRWQWWAGLVGDVDAEGLYELGEFDTRGAAIAAANREYGPGKSFYVVEARSSEAEIYEGAALVPFLRQRNRELLVTGAIMA